MISGSDGEASGGDGDGKAHDIRRPYTSFPRSLSPRKRGAGIQGRSAVARGRALH